MRRVRLLIYLLALFYNVQAQDEAWWRNNVNWDGVSGYQKYISFMPGFMGPNCLPVPVVRNGLTDSVHHFTVTASGHFRTGDVTINPSFYGAYVLVPGVISFDAWYVPAEWFQTSHALKTERKIYYWYYNTKWAQGDLQLNTNIQLLNKLSNAFKLSLRMGFRFPTSNGVGAARFTDAAGYSFDLNGSAPLNKSNTFYWKGMLGFYNWQMGNLQQQQNDALLAGCGFEWRGKNKLIDFYFAGYSGYLKNSGDKPFVLRMGYEHRFKKLRWLLRLQKGVHDFKYLSIETGAGYIFKPKR